jgi:hypothetical protein
MPNCCQGGAWIKPHAIAQGGGCAAAQIRPSSMPFSPVCSALLKRAAPHCSRAQLWHGPGRQYWLWNNHVNLACLQGSVLQHATSHALPVRCPPFQSVASCHRHLSAAAIHLHHPLAGLGLEAASHPHTQHTAGRAQHPAVERQQQLSTTYVQDTSSIAAWQRRGRCAACTPGHSRCCTVPRRYRRWCRLRQAAGAKQLENELAPRLLKPDGTTR